MKKLILASTAAIVATLSFASVSEAGFRHHNHHVFGAIDLAFNVGQTYADDEYGVDEDEGSCYVKKIRKINRYGERVIKLVQVCN